MSRHVFTYGSLMFPQVWESVVRGRYQSAPAILTGYARYAIKEETYPGVIVQAGALVTGIVYFDVDADDLAALDAFEGEEYRRATVGVDVTSSDASVTASTYLYLPQEKLAAVPWDPAAFQLERFLQTYCRFR